MKEVKKCSFCDGTGKRPCSFCGGIALNVGNIVIFGFPTPCTACGGRGKVTCTYCNGTGKQE